MRGESAGRRRRWPVVAALVVALGTLAGCSTVHESLGTSDAPCYIALPTASKAVDRTGHLDGVRLRKVSSLKSIAALEKALEDAAIKSGRVCLVAFTGDFSASAVAHPSGRMTGHLAVVILRYPNGKLVSTVLFSKLPTNFGHSHLG
jgi:hypothetical protein